MSPLRWFQCPDNERIETVACLAEGGCRMGSRCASRSYLKIAARDRRWTGKPSTTQLIGGTLHAFLRITKDYAISPDSRAFMITGTKSHAALEDAGDEYSLLEERFDGEDVDITGIADILESENGRNIEIDTKVSGSYKVAKALGFYVEDEETGEVYKSGKKKGQPKTRKVLKRDDSKIDRREWELQLSKYAIEFEKRGFKVDELRIQAIVRDGNTYIARSRGVFRNVYFFKINRIPDMEVLAYFERKRVALLMALELGWCDEICTAEENWDGLKCQKYCEVAEHCKYGKFLKQERTVEEMAIKGLSEVRRLPRLGKIRLGIKKKNQKGVEYPAEVDYFILDPQTPSDLENQKLIEEFQRLYGEQPKSIKIMFPVADSDVYFPQFYKRYGSGASLKCKGDGETASCTKPEFAEGLKQIGKDELDLIRVQCHGKECPYYQKKECSEVGTLQILLPELPGAGVWQISTGSFHSIVNVNSCIEYIKAVCGRAHMIPLTLERREQETSYDGKKSKHYILHVNMDFRLSDIQKFAMIDPTKVLLELPAPEAEKEDILYQENRSVDIDMATGEVLQPGELDIRTIIRDRITDIQKITSQTETEVLKDFSSAKKNGKDEVMYARDLDHLMKSDAWAKDTLSKMDLWIKANTPPASEYDPSTVFNEKEVRA
ncbi:MAG: hypothetical protein IT393_07165 [Nitrospirae bacterium]|nr:hypothetical protein [Nitrospirota bacterium]